MSTERTTLVIACGALAREIVALRKVNDWQHIDVQCLSANLHNTPNRIPEAVRQSIRVNRPLFSTIFVAYGDCGTGGELDAVLDEEGVERIPGAHCYEFFATQAVFDALAEEEPGSFFLTDFLLRHFERLVITGLGLDRHPDLLMQYFGNYRRLVYLVQNIEEAMIDEASSAAKRLGLAFEYRVTGYGELEHSLRGIPVKGLAWQHRS